MASSRWKRFAFFDRKTLPLPPPVVKDLVPSTNANRQQSSSSSASSLDPAALYPEEPTTEDCIKIGSGEYFSLVGAPNVTLPTAISSSHGVKRGSAGDGASAMLASLMALRSSSVTKPVQDYLHLLFVSSRNTNLIHCIDVSIRCTPQNPYFLKEVTDSDERKKPIGDQSNLTGVSTKSAFLGDYHVSSSKVDSTTNINDESNTNLNDLDGWRGYFDPFKVADGIVTESGTSTGGIAKTSSIPAQSSNNGATITNANMITGSGSNFNAKKLSVEQRILDEHLRGNEALKDSSLKSTSLFASSPFFTNQIASVSGQSTVIKRKTRIVGLATASTSSFSKFVLYVAAITDAPNSVGVVVHANPHLMLSTTMPASSSLIPPSSDYSMYYKPFNGEFNFSNNGSPRCVSILPGVVCVGTDIGIILIYVFHCQTNHPEENKTNSNVATSGGGKLTLVAEIPAPKGEDAGRNAEKSESNTAASLPVYAVSSVELIRSKVDFISKEEQTSEQRRSYSFNNDNGIYRLFVSYRRRIVTETSSEGTPTKSGSLSSTSTGPYGGICCYDLGGLRIPGNVYSVSTSTSNVPVVSARYDIDGKDVGSSCLCDVVSLPSIPLPPVSSLLKAEDGVDKERNDEATAAAASVDTNDINKMFPRYSVARGDGLHLYSTTEKIGVCPVDGNKILMCSLAPPPSVYLKRPLRTSSNSTKERVGGSIDYPLTGIGASYSLVASTDSKSGRDAVDIYDTINKLVGFHVLLSPGHRALRCVGIASHPIVDRSSLIRGGRSSAVILTSGGSIVTLIEKVTVEKVSLLVQKNLYAAAISIAFSDPAFYRPEDITALYLKYAEYLYRKGDFAAAMDQYILTIGCLESSYVIFRFLDAPKIPLVVKYLEALRAQGLASKVHDELLRTCYLKLNDHESAGKIIITSSSSVEGALPPMINPDGSEIPTVSITRNLLACADDPSEMLAAICSLNAPEAVEALVAHGPLLARSLPREIAGVVIALCDGSYSPTAVADAAAGRSTGLQKNGENKPLCEKYPISLFANSFLENPKLFRLILSYCRRNEYFLTPSLRKTLLELTLDEWNAARRTGDAELEKARHNEAITILSENQADENSDYEALVTVQTAGFTDGEILLYERLNMIPMLLEKYASSGSERARRQMLAMCEHDPELYSEVLAYFVAMAGEKLKQECPKEDVSVDSESDIGGLLHDIHEALLMARDHGNIIPPVRVLRILAGEGCGQFSMHNHSHIQSTDRCCVPLSVAMDYVGAILDSSNAKIHMLKSNVEEYSRLCNDMELEIDALLTPSAFRKDLEGLNGNKKSLLPKVDIDEMYSYLCSLSADGGNAHSIMGKREKQLSEKSKEQFWRDMEHTTDPFETMCFHISKGYLENI